MRKSRSSSGSPLQLVWVGLSPGCKGKRLNSQSVLAGTDLAVGLEQIRPSGTDATPRRVYFFQRVEPLLRRLLPHKPDPFESLALDDQSQETGYIAWAQTFTLINPGVKGTATVVCSMTPDCRDPAPHVTSVSNGVIHASHKKARPEFQLDLPSIFHLKLGRIIIKPQSEKVLKYDIIAPLDPEIEFDVLVPGGQPDLNDYLRHYIAEVAPILGVSYSELDEELQRTYGPALAPTVGERFRGSVTPPTLSLDDGASATITLTVANDSASGMPALLALRATNRTTKVAAVSDLLAINMPLLAMDWFPGRKVSPAESSAGQPRAAAS
jgi:hypothetical protein